MFYQPVYHPTDFHLVDNSLGERYYCNICDKQLVWKKENCTCYIPGDRSEDHVTYHCGTPGDSGKISSPLLAVRRPTRASLEASLKSDTATPIQDKIFKAQSQSEFFNLPVEVRYMIYSLVLLSEPLEIDVLPVRLCPHVDALEFRLCKEEGNRICHAQNHSRCQGHCACMVRRNDRRNDRATATQWVDGNLLNVCRAMQLDVLRFILPKQKFHFNDATELRNNLNLPAENAMLSDEPTYGDATPGGFDRLMETFRPVCTQIRSMQITTFVDTDCIDIGEFMKKERDVTTQGQGKMITRYYRGAVPAPRENPNTVLSFHRFGAIFSSVRELHVRIAPQPMDDLTRELPRYLVRKEFMALFKNLSRMALNNGSVTFLGNFARRYTGPAQSTAQTLEELALEDLEDCRKFGRHVTQGFLKMVSKTAEKTMLKRR
ncbi:hypothetical protein H2200_010165 [Cladophialophora chaetospira]|uniref:DUF7730 domain-containing protein n=1 Tax=Cladophialophora chaetospira TaxID=386627 RepID=A0AA38X2A7_9EURO|nr:hypothetical protein H2200_010165 [Cladophialophora chaetospira]